jgi:CheY-like chemotaxis protein
MHNETESQVTKEPSPAVKRVLVVDDDSGVVETVGKLLRSEGFEVVSAGDGAEALAQARQFVPDVIILDLTLPSLEAGAGQLDGFGVMKWFSLRLPKSIPVIVLTGRQDNSTRREAEALGASAFIGKPFIPHELLSAVRQATTR